MQAAITSAAALYTLRNVLPQGGARARYLMNRFSVVTARFAGLQLFLVPVTLSRMFLYAYDLVEVQARGT